IVPGIDPDNLVFEDYGRAGRAWAETDEDHTSLDAVTSDLLTGHYSRPLRVISSIPPKDGRETCRKTWHTSCAAVPSSRIASCRLRLSHSWSDTKGPSPKAETKIKC